jgi:hypothetical protein
MTRIAAQNLTLLLDSMIPVNQEIAAQLAIGMGLIQSPEAIVKWLPICYTRWHSMKQSYYWNGNCETFAVAKCKTCGSNVCESCLLHNFCDCLPF